MRSPNDRVPPVRIVCRSTSTPSARSTAVCVSPSFVMSISVMNFGKPQIVQPVVAHVVRAVAVQAVIDERVRTPLKRYHVQRIELRMIERELSFGGTRERGQEQTDRREFLQRFHQSRSHIDTRAGSALVLSMREYQGISRKNAK